MSEPISTRACFRHRGFTLSYLDSAPGDGQRPAVLLLHGFPDDARMWSAQVQALHDAGYRCIAPDTLGCGQSDVAPRVRDYNTRRVADDHRALLDHLGIEQAHVVGHDWGAVVAWFFAGYYPERTDRLVVISVGHPTVYARSGLKQKLVAWYTYFFQLGGLSEWLLKGHGPFSLRRVFGSHPDMDEVMERLAVPGRMTAALRMYRAAIIPVLLQKQPRIAADTLGLWSEGDAFLVESQMKDSGRWVDGDWSYVRLSGGHWIPLEQPELTNRLLLQHLAGETVADGG